MTTNFLYGASEEGGPTDLTCGVVADCDEACRKMVVQMLGYLGQDATEPESTASYLSKEDLLLFMQVFYEAMFEVSPEKLPFHRSVAGIGMFIETTTDDLYDPLYE